MRQFQTTVLDTFRFLEDGYATEPYETAWASEATFYVRVDEAKEGAGPYVLTVERSPDGMAWLATDHKLVLDPANQLSAVDLTHFGGWLRLRHTSGPGDAIKATVYIVLKE